MTTLIIGERGEGKTTLAKYLARSRSRVVLMFEPKPDEATQDVELVNDDVELFDAIERAKDAGSATIAYVPDDDVMQGFDDFVGVITTNDKRVRYLYGGITVIVDEGWTLMNPQRSHRELERLLRLAPRSGYRTINVIVIAHKPADINQRTHTFSDELFLFRFSEKSDLDRIAECWRPEIADVVQAFPDNSHYVVHYDKNRRKVEVWNHPELWASGQPINIMPEPALIEPGAQHAV